MEWMGDKNIFGAMKMMIIGRSVSSGMKKELYERVLVQSQTYGTETLGMRKMRDADLMLGKRNSYEVCAEL